MNKQHYRNQASQFFLSGYSCSQAVFMAFAPSFGLEEKIAKSISLPFGGGMGIGATCGALTGGFMALGLGIDSSMPPLSNEKVESKTRLQKMIATIEKEYTASCCSQLLENWEKTKQTECTKKQYCTALVARVSELVFDELNKQV